MANLLNSRQWGKVAAFIRKNRDKIESLSTHEQLDKLMRGDLLGKAAKWCDVGDVAESCKSQGVRCPAPPVELRAPTTKQLQEKVRQGLSIGN